MKRGTAILEPWTTKEKLCLSSAVLRSGDQNWMSVSRALRVFGEPDRPADWYSQKQCALQYEALLNSVGTSKRKKRSEKGVETIDTPGECIVRRLLQERVEELYQLIEEDRKAYIKLQKEIEDIESGRADDRLDEFEREIEEEEREAARGSILRQHEERSRLESGRTTPLSEAQSPETKVPTSPLLTSLLQSPSHYRSSTIHNLLNPPPPYSRPNDSPTLSRLLESPAKQMDPTILFTSPVKKEPVEEEQGESSQTKSVSAEPTPVPESVPEVVQEVLTGQPVLEVKSEPAEANDVRGAVQLEDDVVEPPVEVATMQMQEVEVEISADLDKTASVSISKVESEDADGEKEEQEPSLNNLQDSDTMEEQPITELDSQTVNMIVAGGGMISVSHDTSSEHLEEVTSSDIQHKDDSEAAESVKEDSLDGVNDEISDSIKGIDTTASISIESNSAVEVEDLNNFIIGSETPKDKYVVQLLCSTPENILEEEAKTPEVKEFSKTENSEEVGKLVTHNNINISGAMLEVGGEVVNLGGAEVVEEEVDTTVHEVEVLVSELNAPGGGKGLDEEDSNQDEELKQGADTPETEPNEESQEEDEPSTVRIRHNEENEKLDKNEEEKTAKENSFNILQTVKSIDNRSETPSTMEDDSESREGTRRPTKKRLISGSVHSDSKPSSPACHTLEDSKEYRSWKKSIMLVFNRLATHKYASIFLRPITNEQAPAYDTVIHRPVDLSTIKKRIETGELRTTVEFQRDLLLMFQNAIMYNNCRTHVYEMASIMQNECLQHIELMVEAMGEGVPWRKDSVTMDKLHTRGRGETPKRKRVSAEESKSTVTPKRKKEAPT